jgi:type VI secretion system protein ImpH
MYKLRPEELSILGRQNCILGRGLTLGPRQPLRGRRVRLRIGPMSRADFEYFLPEARGASALAAFLRLFKLDGMAFEVQLVLRAQDVIPMQLGRGHKLGHGYTLGRQVPARDFDGYRYELALS